MINLQRDKIIPDFFMKNDHLVRFSVRWSMLLGSVGNLIVFFIGGFLNLISHVLFWYVNRLQLKYQRMLFSKLALKSFNPYLNNRR